MTGIPHATRLALFSGVASVGHPGRSDSIAGTGPGIPDYALAPGESELPKAPSDEEVEKMAKKLGSPSAEKDTLPLEGE